MNFTLKEFLVGLVLIPWLICKALYEETALEGRKYLS